MRTWKKNSFNSVNKKQRFLQIRDSFYNGFYNGFYSSYYSFYSLDSFRGIITFFE